jgi:predicted component of type VI protein secretion system
MKRPPPTFVVEFRRQRRSTNADAKTWSAPPPLAYPASGPGRPSGAAALFEAEAKAPPAPEASPPRPRGRILPSLADLESVAPPVEEAAASPRRRRKSSAPTPKPARKAKVASPSAKPKREVAPAEAPPGVVATRALVEAMPAATDAASENATAERAGARQARHRRILERYVLGAEIKPGERWKRRLPRAR